MVGCGSHLLSGVELGVIVRSGQHGQIALAQVDAHHLRKICWGRVAGLNRERHPEIKPLPGAVIPEFGPADGSPLLEPGHMPIPALVGQHEPSREGVDAHLSSSFQGEVASRDVGHRRRDIMGRLVQPFEALFRPARFARFHIFVPFRPQGFVGGPHLAEDAARHLGGQAIRGTSLLVELVVQALALGGLPMGKGILAGLVECIPIGQLRLPQGSKLLRSCDQFQFGSNRRLHRKVFCFNRSVSERRRCFLPRLKTVGIRTAQLMKK